MGTIGDDGRPPWLAQAAIGGSLVALEGRRLVMKNEFAYTFRMRGLIPSDYEIPADLLRALRDQCAKTYPDLEIGDDFTDKEWFAAVERRKTGAASTAVD